MGQEQGFGALTGSRASMEPASGLHPTGFDPERFKPKSYEGKPRNLSKPHRNALSQFIKYIDASIDAMTPQERRVLLEACMSVSPINCAWDQFKVAEIVVWHLQETAIAIEAAPAGETPKDGSTEGESAGRNGIAQKKPGDKPPTFPNTASQKDSPDV